MVNDLKAARTVALYVLQYLAMGSVTALAAVLTGYGLACAFGAAPWLSLEMRFGETLVPQAGMLVQLAVTLLTLSLLFYLPTNARVLALEHSHRSFHMNMRDVARAYAAAHKADREGVFTLPSEFDSIRDRIAFLRSHPELDMLQGEVMELAAQMSHVSRELAKTYSDDNVARARDFLIQRQEDIAEFEDRVRLAKSMTEDLTRWHRRVALEEEVAQSQLDQLRAELADILPELAQPIPQDRTSGASATAPAAPDLNDEPDLYAEDDRIVALLARRATP